MIRCSHGHTTGELLAEFDRLLGQPNPQKPITCRKTKKERRNTTDSDNKFVILIPEGIDVDKVEKDLGRSLSQRYFLILSSIYVRALTNKRIQKYCKGYLRCNSLILRELGGEKYKLLIDYGLDEGHLEKKDQGAIRGVVSLQYRLNQDVMRLKGQVRFQLTTKHARNARSRCLLFSKERFLKGKREANDPVLVTAWKKVLRSYEQITYDYFASIKFVAQMGDGPVKKHRRNFIENMILDGEVWTTDSQGRNYTLVVCTPRDMRRFFYCGEKPLWVVDITSSQPVIHIALYREECEEKKRYQEIVEGANFWDFMNNKAGGLYDLLDPEAKRTFKRQIFREVFYSWHPDDLKEPTVFGTIFASEFPILWQAINSTKVSNAAKLRVFKPSADLARAMQRTEAEIVADAVVTLRNKPYPLITIHDAIVTTSEGIADVVASLEGSFRELGLFPKLVPYQLSHSH